VRERPKLLAALVAVCWWRARLAYIIDVNQCILVPDAVVQVLAYELPSSGRKVWEAMLDWSRYREGVRQGQQERNELESLQDEARFLLEQEDAFVLSSRRHGVRRPDAQSSHSNPFAAPLDMWQPGCLMWWASWHLACLLRDVKAGTLPGEVCEELFGMATIRLCLYAQHGVPGMPYY
jgi:hypothetical protein